MEQSAFEMALKGDGFQEIVTVRFEPGHDVGDHAHPYDVRALILEGEFTIVTDGGARTYRPGEIFALETGRRHTEKVGPDGVRFLAGRRR